MAPPDRVFRTAVRPEDREAVRRIVRSSGFFYQDEVEIAVELVDEALQRGDASGYHFVFAEIDGIVAGYACFGPIPGTGASFDLYWIALDDDFRGQGLGGAVLRVAEERMHALGGARIYAETSSRPQYEPTRRFYERRGFCLEARLEAFYYPGDDKLIYVKRLLPRADETARQPASLPGPSAAPVC